MKTWDDLTKAEKEKLDMYIKIKTAWQSTYTVATIVCFLGMFIGLPLMFTAFLPLIFAGLFILGISVIILFFILIMQTQDRKRLYLMFGVDGVMKETFDISMEDLRKTKRMYIWKKEK